MDGFIAITDKKVGKFVVITEVLVKLKDKMEKNQISDKISKVYCVACERYTV